MTRAVKLCVVTCFESNLIIYCLVYALWVLRLLKYLYARSLQMKLYQIYNKLHLSKHMGLALLRISTKMCLDDQTIYVAQCRCSGCILPSLANANSCLGVIAYTL